MSRQDLLRQIANAFSSSTPPAATGVLYEGAYSGDPELEEIKLFFGGREWQSITPSDVFRFRHALSFFSDCALAYYAPAWMSCSLLDADAVDTAIEDLAGTLGRKDPSLWTHEQRRAICNWLTQMRSIPLAPTLELALRKFGCIVSSSN